MNAATQIVIASLATVLGLLRRVRPYQQGADVRWHGPYVIPRRRVWHESHFMLYNGRLIVTVDTESRPMSLE